MTPGALKRPQAQPTWTAPVEALAETPQREVPEAWEVRQMRKLGRPPVVARATLLALRYG